MTTIVDMNELGNIVRYWVYYDDAIHKGNTEIRSLRAKRDKCELAMIQKLKTAKQEKAILQIAGGRLQIVEEKQMQNLCYKNLKEMLHEYYKQKTTPGIKDETDEILQFLKSHRHAVTTERIRRHNTG
jgi:hypothetical protein|uniref:Uncharacterized protein n=1 Tax=viral metagenome TaxID=1070528 RepID=A0A6C0DD65_9ZZZZ